MTENELLNHIVSNPKGTPLSCEPLVRGDANLSGEDVTWLPDGLVITGSLALDDCWNLKDLPSGLFVGGDLRLRLSSVTALPPDLDVRGDIHAENLDLAIPEGFTVHGSLYLNGVTGMADPLEIPLHLPDGLTVEDTLDVTDRVIPGWPRNLTVKGGLRVGHVDDVSGEDVVTVLSNVTISRLG